VTPPGDHPDQPAGHHVAVRGATKSYGPVRALDAVDFEAEPGEFLVLLGPSGSGKSTLVRSLAGIERLDAGTVTLSGQLVSDGRRHLPPERRDLAMVFQDYALWPHLSVTDNVGYALRRRRLPTADHTRRVHAALERVGLHRHAHRYPSELSGGEQQRVALARAVVAEPGLLLFDEPLSNLDADLRERLRVEISTLTRDCGATAVYITHDQSEAFALADRIGVLNHGRLLQLGTPEEIYRRPATPFVARFTGVAGELPGTVLADDGHFVTVRLGPAVVRARRAATMPPGTQVAVLVRPAATSIPTGPTGPTASHPPESGLLTGTVTDVAYRGRGYDHVVACEPGTLSAVHSTHPYPRGTQVPVALDAEGCLAFAHGDVIVRDIGHLTTVTLPKSDPLLELAGPGETWRRKA
jgi:iron(III) transport system ATP-binding protein